MFDFLTVIIQLMFILMIFGFPIALIVNIITKIVKLCSTNENKDEVAKYKKSLIISIVLLIGILISYYSIFVMISIGISQNM